MSAGGGPPRRVTGLEIDEAEDGLVVYDPRRERVHHLNPSAALVFDLCDGTRGPAEIAAALGEAFGLDAPPRKETEAALERLAAEGLVAVPPPS